MKTDKRALAFCFFLAVAAAAETTRAPTPLSLLDSIISDHPASYQGRAILTRWTGQQTRSEEVKIYHSPPGRYRWEFFAADGSLDRVIVSDGDQEQVSLPRQRKIFSGGAIKTLTKVMSAESERALLLKNYSIRMAGEKTVAGRRAWELELLPKVADRPQQKILIDQETRVILENKRFRPNDPFAVHFRFTEFEPVDSLPDDLFRLEPEGREGSADHGLDPDFLSMDELREDTGKRSHCPAELPEGFVFESASHFNIGEKLVRHFRYTDGLAVVSLFLTDLPARPNLKGREAQSRPGELLLSMTGAVYPWKAGSQYFTLVGDISPDLVDRIAASWK